MTGLPYQAKVAASSDSAITNSLPIPKALDYGVDLIATFSHVIRTTIRAEPGLTGEEISERVDSELPNLAGYQGQLIDSQRELEKSSRLVGMYPTQEVLETDGAAFEA